MDIDNAGEMGEVDNEIDLTAISEGIESSEDEQDVTNGFDTRLSNKELFMIRCRIMGKVCRVIIDSGSTNNMISEEAVEKLKLERISHANPFKVTWLNKKQHVLVGEQAWVEFTIGKYKDKLLYDIIPMDACHLLLGRSW